MTSPLALSLPDLSRLSADWISARRARCSPYRLCIFSIRPLRPDFCPVGDAPSDPGWFQPVPALSSLYFQHSASQTGSLSDGRCPLRPRMISAGPRLIVCVFCPWPLRPYLVPSAWSVSKPRPPNGSDVSFLVISPSRSYSVSCRRPPDETPHLPDSFGPCSIARPRQVNCPIGWLRCRFWRAGTRLIPPRLCSPPSWRRSRRCLSVTPAVPELLLMAPFSSH